jgi:hypothetical protein
MKHLLPTVLVLSGFFLPPAARAESLRAAERLAYTAPRQLDYIAERHAQALRAWKRSLIPLAATQTLDITSSFGMRERNPLLAGPDGRFGTKAVSIKAATTAAMVGVEYLLVKRWPASARALSKLNWASSILTGSVAAHNYAIR